MKITCGTDIIEIERIKNAIENVGEKFLKTVFTEKEIKYCEARKAQKYQSYAGRFAVKEAVFKALSDKLEGGINWQNFEVVKLENGKPVLKLHCVIDDLESIDISISHCKEYASANVVAQFRK